jgi:glycosyltransferase involved in cell wall biosynthesis
VRLSDSLLPTSQDTAVPLVRKPRILISINTSWNIYNFRSGLIRALVDTGYEVIAAAPTDAYSAQLNNLGCRYVPIAMDNKGTSFISDIFLFLRYVQLMRQEQPDIYLAYTIKPNVYSSLAAQALKIPVINNISGLGTAFITNNWVTWVVKLLYRASLARSQIVFFQNPDDFEEFVEYGLVQKEQSFVIPGSGIDLKAFRPHVKEPAKEEEFRFLLIARLLWDKGIGEYVEAARIVRRQSPSVIFQIVGFLGVENRTAVPGETVEGWVADGLIDYLGVSDDVRPAIAAADCVVLPSYREGMPRTLLEAAAMGKPLIATDVPGCRQIVDHGVNGLLCRVRDANDLARRMLEMIAISAEGRTAMGAAGRAKTEREFDENIVVQRYLEAVPTARLQNPP